jgi:hypothetical protein
MGQRLSDAFLDAQAFDDIPRFTLDKMLAALKVCETPFADPVQGRVAPIVDPECR